MWPLHATIYNTTTGIFLTDMEMFRSGVIAIVSQSQINTRPKIWLLLNHILIPYYIMLMYCIKKLFFNNLTAGRFELIWNSSWKIQYILEPVFLCRIKIRALRNYDIFKFNSQACLVDKFYFGIIVVDAKINISCWINDWLVVVDGIENYLNEYLSYVTL